MKPTILNVPNEIVTDRLLLRVPRVGDGEVVFASVQHSLAELKPWLPWANEDYNLEGSEQWCRKTAANVLIGEEASYLIFNRESNRHLGNISSYAKDWRGPKFEIGYWLRSGETGHGYMTEAVKAVTEVVFEILTARRIEIRVDAENPRSCAVAERAGYQLEGIFHHDSRNYLGELRHTKIFAMIR